MRLKIRNDISIAAFRQVKILDFQLKNRPCLSIVLKFIGYTGDAI
jgi:hypothetical protein